MSDYNLGIDMYVTIKGDINLYREIESFVEDKLGLWDVKDKEITLKGQYDTNDYGRVLVGNMPEGLTCEDSILKKLVFDYNADIGFELALFHDLCKHGKWHKIQNGNRAGKSRIGLPPIIAY